MHRVLGKILQYLLPLLIGGGLLWYALRDIAWADLAEQFRRADYRWILVSAGLAILSHLSRAYRWQLLLTPLGYRTSLYHAFLAVMSGYFVNLVIPRAGEISRCGMIEKLDKVPTSTAFGTVVVERLIDVCMLFILLLILLVAEFQTLSDWILGFIFSKFQALYNQAYLLLILGFVLLLGLAILLRYWVYLKENALVIKIKGILLNVWQGMRSIQSVRNKPAFVFHTLFIWWMYYLMSYVLFFCFPTTSHLDMWFGFIVLIMGAIGMAAPVQGGIGTYHLLVGQIFTLRGLTAKQGSLMAFFMHTSQTLVVLILGSVALTLGFMLMGRSRKS